MNINNLDAQKYVNSLSNDILIIDLSRRELTKLPDLSRFTKLQELYCNCNQLTFIPPLPNSLQILSCYNNKLTYLPNLPNSLQELYCLFNKLTILADHLPDSLTILHCSNNQLTSLPDLPNSLKYLNCEKNQLTSLPDLPNSLQILHCENNPKLEKVYPLLNTFKTILEQKKYIQDINYQLIKEKAEKRMKQLNPEEGGLIETTIKHMMRPDKIALYLEQGYNPNDIFNLFE